MADKTLQKPTLFIIDSLSLIFQAYYAIRNLKNAKGQPTNAVFGFVKKLQKLMEDYQPSHIIAVFESTTPTFRKELYPAYKANREKPPEDFEAQMPYIFEVLDAMGIPRTYVDGYEADDVIGTLTRMAREADMEALIVSADKDLFQLLDDKVRMLRSHRDALDIMGPEDVRQKMGVPPESIIDYLAMVGDSSDNIPGLPGVGPKTAVKFIGQYQTLENLLENADSIKSPTQREKVKQHAEQARLSRKLATICCDVVLDVDVQQLKSDPKPDAPALLDLYRELGFVSLLRESRARTAQEEEAGGPVGPEPPLVMQYRCALTEADLDALLNEMTKAEWLAFDTETTSVNVMEARMVGLSLSARPGAAWYIPVGHAPAMSCGSEITLEMAREKLAPLFSGKGPRLSAHNAKYDLHILRRHGFQVPEAHFDTMLASYLLNPGGRHGLKHLAMVLLHEEMTEIQELIGKGSKAITMEEVSVDQAATYACADADMTLRLTQHFEQALEKEGLLHLLREMELPLVNVLQQIEAEGIALNTNALRELGMSLQKKSEALAAEIFEMAGRVFNIKSTQQVADILFSDIGLKPLKKTKTGYSTNSAVLEDLARSHPLPARILEYRHCEKLLSTYVEALPRMVQPKTGRVHTTYNQFITATGRLSSSDPNLQNIPIRSEEGKMIRRAFVPNRPDEVLLAADYSQIELRVMAHLTDDPALKQAFVDKTDIHTQTAAKVFGMPEVMVTPEMRAQAKVINFGIIYGMGAHRLSNELDISRKQAQEFIDEYFAAYPRVRTWMDKTLEEAREKGYVKTMSGRRRMLPDLHSKNHNVRSNAERIAINTPVQGASADMIKLAMIQLDREIRQKGWRVRMVLQVHDELVCTVPEAELAAFEPLLVRIMQDALPLSVPIEVDVACGRNWAEC